MKLILSELCGFKVDDGKQCKGLVYRFKESFYMGSRGEIVEKRIFSPLKKLSCDGCVDCDGLFDMLSCELDEGMIPFPSNLNSGDAVSLVAINDGRCFEDLYDEYHLEFKKIEE